MRPGVDTLPSPPFLLASPAPGLVEDFRAGFCDKAESLHQRQKRLRPVREPGRGESTLHALIKREIASGMEAASWKLTPEARGGGWRADLLAEREGQKLALEVQLSPSTLEQYRARQARYEAAGIRCVWLCAYYPKGYTPDPALVILRLTANPEGELVIGLPRQLGSSPSRCLDGEVMPLSEGLERLLRGEVVFRAQAELSPYLEIVAWRAPCWKCGYKLNHLWDVLYHGRAECGLPLKPEKAPPGYESRLASALIEFMARQELPARIRPRYSETLGRAYPSFGCLKCEAIFGDWFLRATMMDLMYAPPIWGVLPAPTVQVAHPHWCVGAGCEQKNSAGVDVNNQLWLPV